LLVYLLKLKKKHASLYVHILIILSYFIEFKFSSY